MESLSRISVASAAIATAALAVAWVAYGAQSDVGKSPWGPNDELGRLNLMTEKSKAEILGRIATGRTYDLSVEYFIGMPSWHGVGDPRYQFWLTHTPRGTVIDDPMQVGTEQNLHVGYTGSAFSMYSHMGTHIDALNHFGLNGKIWNGFRADDHLGDRGWKKTGAETIPPIIARGVMIDVAGYRKVDMLPKLYRITRADLEGALRAQNVELRTGDVVLIRTGRMKKYNDDQAYMSEPPGLGFDAAQYLIEEGGADSRVGLPRGSGKGAHLRVRVHSGFTEATRRRCGTAQADRYSGERQMKRFESMLENSDPTRPYDSSVDSVHFGVSGRRLLSSRLSRRSRPAVGARWVWRAPRTAGRVGLLESLRCRGVGSRHPGCVETHRKQAVGDRLQESQRVEALCQAFL
jgi:kynurenine formamidase